MKKRYYVLISLILAIISFLFVNILANDDKDFDQEADNETINIEKCIYLAVGEELVVENLGCENKNVLGIYDNVVIGQKAGIAYLKIDDHDYLEIIASDLYTTEILNNQKQYLPSNCFTYEDNVLLDEVLKYLINEKGYQSRAAVVEAARFLTLRFKYKLAYFYENGRLYTDIEDFVCDGEGRYYHQGLYLSKEKYEEISISEDEPAIWGNDLYCNYYGYSCPNGLDCSGFVCWALLNGGYDCLDLGAGPVKEVYDLTDLGKKVKIDKVDIDEIKPGDLIGFDGHIGIIIGIDDNNLYIGQSYVSTDLSVEILGIDEMNKQDYWQYIILMDEYYLEDGNLSYMW